MGRVFFPVAMNCCSLKDAPWFERLGLKYETRTEVDIIYPIHCSRWSTNLNHTLPEARDFVFFNFLQETECSKMEYYCRTLAATVQSSLPRPISFTQFCRPWCSVHYAASSPRVQHRKPLSILPWQQLRCTPWFSSTASDLYSYDMLFNPHGVEFVLAFF